MKLKFEVTNFIDGYYAFRVRVDGQTAGYLAMTVEDFEEFAKTIREGQRVINEIKTAETAQTKMMPPPPKN